MFPLFLLCVMQNGFSHAQFQSCTISVMHLLVMHLSVMQNIKEQCRKIISLFHFLTILYGGDHNGLINKHH